VAEGVIMRIGGWKTRSVFERYNIITQSDIKDAMTKLQTSEKQQQEEQRKEGEPNFGHVFGHVGSNKQGPCCKLVASIQLFSPMRARSSAVRAGDS
jgi:hypothetical protein